MNEYTLVFLFNKTPTFVTKTLWCDVKEMSYNCSLNLNGQP